MGANGGCRPLPSYTPYRRCFWAQSHANFLPHQLTTSLSPPCPPADDSVALHEEEVLSDDELSRQFPDEADNEDDEVRHLLGDFRLGGSAFGSDTASQGTFGNTAGGATSDAGGASAPSANPFPFRRQSGRAVRPPAKLQQAVASEMGSHLPEPDQEDDAEGGIDPAEPPIALRTRAQVNLGEVQIEALELTAADDQFLNYGIDDEEEYRRFLEVSGIVGANSWEC
jgi:hypothetical protein